MKRRGAFYGEFSLSYKDIIVGNSDGFDLNVLNMTSFKKMALAVSTAATKEEMSQKLEILLAASRRKLDWHMRRLERQGIIFDRTPVICLESYCNKYNRDPEEIYSWIESGIIPSADTSVISPYRVIRDKEYIDPKISG